MLLAHVQGAWGWADGRLQQSEWHPSYRNGSSPAAEGRMQHTWQRKAEAKNLKASFCKIFNTCLYGWWPTLCDGIVQESHSSFSAKVDAADDA